jgi:NAD(P)-dependent dehydrogenase (short-subunit alcohol dehydrogenase family)
VKTREKSANVPVPEFDRVMNINARAVLLCMQAEARIMLKQPRKLTGTHWKDERRAQVGAIVNFASVCGSQAMPNVMPYIAAKHAVMGMTKSAAIEHGLEGLRVNAICPGIVDTPFIGDLKKVKGGNEQDPVFANPMGRLCYPDEIADAAVYLSSTMSSYVNGAGLVSDGARSTQF